MTEIYDILATVDIMWTNHQAECTTITRGMFHLRLEQPTGEVAPPHPWVGDEAKCAKSDTLG